MIPARVVIERDGTYAVKFSDGRYIGGFLWAEHAQEAIDTNDDYQLGRRDVVDMLHGVPIWWPHRHGWRRPNMNLPISEGLFDAGKAVLDAYVEVDPADQIRLAQ